MSNKSKAKPKQRPRSGSGSEPKASVFTAMTAQAPMPKTSADVTAAAQKPFGADAPTAPLTPTKPPTTSASTKGPQHHMAPADPHAEKRSQVVHAPVHRRSPPPNHK